VHSGHVSRQAGSCFRLEYKPKPVLPRRGPLYCERCGLGFLPRQSICTRCHTSPTRHWLQLAGLATLAVALAYNAFAVLHLLPQFVARGQRTGLFRVWLRIAQALSLYGWIVVAVVLLAWSFYGALHGHKLEFEVRLARLLLIVLLVGSAARFLLPLLRAKWAVVAVGVIQNHTDLVRILPWGTVALALALINLNRETRDRLLGTGRALCLLGLGLLLLVMTFTLLGWRAI